MQQVLPLELLPVLVLRIRLLDPLVLVIGALDLAVLHPPIDESSNLPGERLARFRARAGKGSSYCEKNSK